MFRVIDLESEDLRGNAAQVVEHIREFSDWAAPRRLDRVIVSGLQMEQLAAGVRGARRRSITERQKGLPRRDWLETAAGLPFFRGVPVVAVDQARGG